MKKKAFARPNKLAPRECGTLSLGHCRGIAVWLLFAGFLLSLQPAHAQTAEVSQVKAAYLYNFVKYIEWPSDASRTANDPAVICVIGDDRTGMALEVAIVGKKANGRSIEPRSPRSEKEFRLCQVLFIGFPDKERIATVLRSLAGSSVLTVGQADRFVSLGGMINLVEKNGTIELEINPEAASAAGLKISSRLLVVSRIVTNQPSGENPR